MSNSRKGRKGQKIRNKHVFTEADYYCRLYKNDIFKLLNKRHIRKIKIIGRTMYFKDGSCVSIPTMAIQRLLYQKYRKNLAIGPCFNGDDFGYYEDIPSNLMSNFLEMVKED